MQKNYGSGRWRKLKGIATIQLEDGTMCEAEIHWYEAQGIGQKEFKIKYILE
ncbi:Regulatory protein RecX (fragment) [Planktothrix serta PCC 8927]|uniref:Regulatory protein RecX n=1 Tax=Planktothrix serta PCC 8927 TaxID=671068 RepID=A0A7Z9BSZ8_9CYAN